MEVLILANRTPFRKMCSSEVQMRPRIAIKFICNTLTRGRGVGWPGKVRKRTKCDNGKKYKKSYIHNNTHLLFLIWKYT